MKFPEIPMPEPTFMITVTRGSDRSRRVTMHALRLLLWGVPSWAVEAVLVAGGRHSFWLTLASAYIVLALAMMTVNVRDGGGDAS